VYIETYPESPEVQSIRFGVSPVEDDPQPNNNEAFVTIRKSAPVISAPTLGWSALGFMMLSFLIVGSIVKNFTNLIARM
jgi:hypothetical protein